MSEKTITRYDLEFGDELGNACYVKKDNGTVVMHSDHEAALAAKDARIAELELEVSIFRKARNLAEDALSDQEDAIKELAEISERRQVELSNALAKTDNAVIMGELRTAAGLHRQFVASLSALLEKTK